MEDSLESIFGYLETESLKECRLVCSYWNSIASHLLMKRTFCKLPSTPRDPEEAVNLTSITSFKINGAQLSQLSLRELPSSFPTHLKSVFLTFVPSDTGVSSLTSFLTSISSTKCPQLTHMKIHFEEDLKQRHEFRNLLENSEFQSRQELFRDQEARPFISNCNQPPPKVEPISVAFPIRSLHLSFDDRTNAAQVSAFLSAFIRKEVLPHLKELVSDFSATKWKVTEPEEYPHFSLVYKTIMETFEECGDALRSLRVFKVQSNVPCGVSNILSPYVDHFLFNMRMRDLPGPRFNLQFSRELKELQLGPGLVALRREGQKIHPQFFPRILTPSVASGLKSLDLSGFYISEGSQMIHPSVHFPHMPSLRKLTVELVAFKWIENFNTIFEKAPFIQNLKFKNSWAYSKVRPFSEVKNLINFEELVEAWGPDGYPSLNRLELGDSIDVKDSVTLQKINRIFPNIQALQFTCDDKSRRLTHKIQQYCSDMDVMPLQEIVEGLKGWKSLRHLSVKSWALYSVHELLDHFQDCTRKLTRLQLYDFKRIRYAHPTFNMEELDSESYLNQMKEKMLQLKSSPQLVFVLHNFNCPYQHHTNGDVIHKRSRKCSIMKNLLQFAENENMLNFRHCTT